MTKSKRTPKLALSTQTLVRLTSSQLVAVAGGSGVSVTVCCTTGRSK
jgi:hypothetical protein